MARLSGAAILVYAGSILVMNSYFYDNVDASSTGDDIYAISPPYAECELAAGSSNNMYGLTCATTAVTATPAPTPGTWVRQP
jgi:hypothetical protein